MRIRNTTDRHGHTASQVVLAILLVLLSGVPQLFLSITEFDDGNRNLNARPIARSLFSNRLLPVQVQVETPDAVPCHQPTVPLPTSTTADLEHVAATPPPLLPAWRYNLVACIYRHNSAYI